MWLLVGSLSASLVFALPSVACGLVGGGDEESEEEPAVASTEAEVLQLELDALFRDLDAQKTAHSEAKAKLQELQAQAEAREQEEQSRLVSLEKARLIVLRCAGENTAVYGPNYADAPLVWEVASAESGEEFLLHPPHVPAGGQFRGQARCGGVHHGQGGGDRVQAGIGASRPGRNAHRARSDRVPARGGLGLMARSSLRRWRA